MRTRCYRCMEEYDSEYDICPHCGYEKNTPAKEPYQLQPGMILKDRYIIGVVLGYGGFGTTYKAWDKQLDTVVAIKEYYPAGIVTRIPGEKRVITYSGKKKSEFESGKTRFLDEARNTAKFSKHPNIVNVFDYFEENGTAYIIMEFLDGVSLKEYIKSQGGKIDVETTVSVLTSIIAALKVVHHEGILHRDISPDNIFICANNSIKLIDFGAARFSNMDDNRELSIVLKPGFAPPEQYVTKSKQGPWTDIYALGATMYRAVTGVMPDESVNRQIEDIVKQPKEINPDIPDYINVTLMKAMALNPEFRFQNVAQLEDALLNKKKVISIEKDLKKRKKKRLIGIVVSAVVLLAAIGTCFYIYRDRKSDTELLATQIDVLIYYAEGETQKEAEDTFLQACSEFLVDYPQIELNVEAASLSDYQVKMQSVEYDAYLCPERDYTSQLKCASLSKVYEWIDLENYVGLSEWKSGHDTTCLPLSFTIPVLYRNTILTETSNSLDNDRDAFLRGETNLVVGDIFDYHIVQESLPGIYQVAQAQDNAECYLTDYMVIRSNAGTRQVKAARRLFFYLLGEQAQDALYIKHQSYLPLNRSELQVFTDVNVELDFITTMKWHFMTEDIDRNERYQDFYNQEIDS